MENPFVGIQDATVSKGSRYLSPGNWDLKVLECKLQQSKKNASTTYFIVEFDVIETTAEGFGTGDRVSWLVDMSVRQEMWMGDVKGFAMAIAGIETETDENKVTEDGVFALVQPDNPARGLRAKCYAFNHLTQRGSDFTKTQWSPA